MTTEQLKKKVDDIIALGVEVGDDEAAHSREDNLHLEVIGEFCPPWVVEEIDRLSATRFARWCA